MYFEELSIEEKDEATLSYFKYRDEIQCRGNEEADQYLKRKSYQVKNIVKSKKAGGKQ